MKKVRGARKRPIIILFGDALIVPFAYIAAYLLRFGNLAGFQDKIPLMFLLIITVSYPAVFYFLDLYEPKKKYMTLTSFFEVIFGVLSAGVIVSFLKYLLFLFPIGRGILAIASLLIAVATFFWRASCYQMFKFLIRPKRTVIIGAGKPGRDLAELIDVTVNDFELIGFIDEAPRADDHELMPQKILGSIDRLSDILEKHKIDQVILSGSKEKNLSLTKQLLEARLKGIEITDLPEMIIFLKGKIPINHVPEEWFLESQRFGISEKNVFAKIKRLIDILFSVLILVISLPFWPLIALGIKVNSRGPIFYQQTRVGKNEAVFSLFKFRSMIDKAENDRPVWAGENDTRITVIGKILRKSHLDELPQLINVIRGEMSLIGPRPERPEFVEELKTRIPYYSFRHIMKPGLTGWAQINFPYASSLEESQEKLEYDLFYISQVNMVLDIRIVLRTAKAVLFGRKSQKKKD